MIVIGVDPHKCTHTAVAVDGSSARPRGQRTVRARQDGFGELVGWARMAREPPAPPVARVR